MIQPGKRTANGAPAILIVVAGFLFLSTASGSGEPENEPAICIRGVKIEEYEGVTVRLEQASNPLHSIDGLRFVLSVEARNGTARGTMDVFEATIDSLTVAGVVGKSDLSDRGIVPGFGGGHGLRANDREKLFIKILADLSLTEPTRLKHSRIDLPTGRVDSVNCVGRGPAGERIRIRLHVLKRDRNRYLLILLRTPESGRKSRLIEDRINRVLQSLRLLPLV